MQYKHFYKPYVAYSKGQKISKAITLLSYLSKNERNHSALASGAELRKEFRSLFRRNENKILCFWDFLTFSSFEYFSIFLWCQLTFLTVRTLLLSKECPRWTQVNFLNASWFLSFSISFFASLLINSFNIQIILGCIGYVWLDFLAVWIFKNLVLEN